jgi:hypothetical protein
MCFGLPLQIRQHNLHVPAEFPEDLPARAAWWRERVGIGNNSHARKSPRAFRHGLEDRHALRAERQPLGSVLDVAAGVYAAGVVNDRCPHLEL